MIWRTDHGCNDAPAGFTLIEMIVVLAVLGLVATLLMARGPPRSPALELRGAAATMARTFTAARGRAIATGRGIAVMFDMTRREVSIAGSSPVAFPANVAVAVTTRSVCSGGADRLHVAICFAADGSSSGGDVRLDNGGLGAQISVDWLTGRVSTTAALGQAGVR